MKINKLQSILLYIELLVLVQLIVVIIFFFQKKPWFVLFDFAITSLYSLFILVYLIVKKYKFKTKVIVISLIAVYYLLFFFNLERLAFSNYYVVLLKNKTLLETAIKKNDFSDLSSSSEINGYTENDGVVYFYIRSDHPSSVGIAYSKKREKQIIAGSTGYVIEWGQLYGNWYYFTTWAPN